MPEVRYGGKDGHVRRLIEDADLIAIRTHDRAPLARGPVPRSEAALLDGLLLVAEFPDAGVQVFRRRAALDRGAVPARREALKRSPSVRFAGRVLVDATSGDPVLYTENLFVKFRDDVAPERCLAILGEERLKVKSEPEYAVNAFLAAAPEGTGRAVFDLADRLLARAEVELCHPELVQQFGRRAVFPQQWHLRRTTVDGTDVDAHADVEAAHALSEGEGVVIAVLDDAVDAAHEEFASPGKIVAPRDFFAPGLDDDPGPGSGDDRHGTACAGVACADGRHGASGVAPKARLMPIRMAAGLGSQREAEAFFWAARRGADVISCSWGPPDGRWWEPDDPTHDQVVPLPDHTRLAIDWATRFGRGGKGCLVFFAAGNGNESVDNDGYAGYPGVIAVAACNDRGRRSVYSDFGQAVFCCFPSNDMAWPEQDRPEPLTPGIWTTDLTGRLGYNPGNPELGDAAGDYTRDFGGTSSACPGAAGVAALVLARNPDLRVDEVRDILRRACERIDPEGGAYDADGRSPFYGYGRLNACAAVELATVSEPTDEALVS